MLLPTSLLILLSVAASAEEVRKCFWCGPLAEQVHRSQRAPACGQQLVQTTCDAGYSHCATVATSPPYAESRLCVKFYQDECYSLYCNSSKTWRMICPCQGHLCNGQNTDRETTAFATLAKIEGKHKRSKRSLTNRGYFFSQRKMETLGLPEEQTTDSAITDQTITHFDAVETTTTMSNDVMEDNTKNIQDNIVEQGEENQIQGDQPTEEQIESDVEAASTADGEIVVDMEVIKSETTIILNMDTKTDTTISEESFEHEKILISTSQAEVVKETDSVTDIPKLKSLSTTIELELSVVDVKNSDNMPPPEALQQTVTPSKVETTTTHTTMGTIETSTNDNHMESMETTTHSLIEPLHINEIAKNTGDKQNQTKKNGAGKTNVSVWGIFVMHVVYITL